MDTYTLTGTEKRETEKAWLVATNEHGELWLPKSKTTRSNSNQWTIPRWLAVKKGLVEDGPQKTSLDEYRCEDAEDPPRPLTREEEAQMERLVEDREERRLIIEGELGIDPHRIHHKGQSSVKNDLRVEHTIWYGSTRITNEHTRDVPIEVVEALKTVGRWSSGLTGGHHAQVEHAYVRGNGWEVTFDEKPTFLDLDEKRRKEKAEQNA